MANKNQALSSATGDYENALFFPHPHSKADMK